jgi:biotin carboxyl carrier protein
MFRTLLRLLKWPLTLGVLGGLLWGAYFLHQTIRADDEAEKLEAQPRASEKSVKDRSIKFPKALVQRHGLEFATAEEAEWREQLAVYGRVVPNPAATVTVAAPVAGTLRAEGRWPIPGQRVRAGQGLGQVEIRVSRLEQLDLQSKLADAQIRHKRAEEILERRQQLVNRQAKASPGTVTQVQKEEAEVQLAEAELQADSARAGVDLLRAALDDIDKRDRPRARALALSLFGAVPHAGFLGQFPWAGLGWGIQEPTVLSWSLPLTAPTDGEVTEVGVHPDTAVEAGGLVLRLVDFRRCRLRLDLPPALLTAGPPGEVALTALAPPAPALAGATNQLTGGVPPPTVTAQLLGPAPEVDPVSQFARYWYEIDFRSHKAEIPGLRDGVSWRPGLFVKSYLKAPQAVAESAVIVPADAVLFHQGRAVVYVRSQSDADQYLRREVRILGRQGERSFLMPRDPFGDERVGVDAGEVVVSKQSQVLLSEEFRSEIDND